MFYCVVLTLGTSFYVFGESDEHALEIAHHTADEVGQAVRLVFVSAHNDPPNGPSGMRQVYRADTDDNREYMAQPDTEWRPLTVHEETAWKSGYISFNPDDIRETEHGVLVRRK